MKDLIYTHEFPPFAGGAGIYSYDLAVGLAELGVEVHVATPGPPRRDESVAWESLIRLPVHYMARWQTEIPWAHYFLLRLYWRHRFDMLLVTERAAQERIAHLQHPWFRYITVVHGTEVLDYFEGTKENRPVTSQEMGREYQRADFCIAVSQATLSLSERLLAGRNIRLALVQNGIDTGRLGQPDSEKVQYLRAAYGADAEIIFCLGRLAMDKGHDILLRAFAEVLRVRPRARLLIGGDGPFAGRLKELRDELALGDRVEFLGKIPQDEIPGYFALCDVFAMPSRCERRWEGFGLVYLEANFYGKPVVGGNEGGVPEAIADGESGLVVDSRDAHAVAAAIIRILADPELRRTMGARGQARLFARFTAKRMAEETLQLIRRSADEPRPFTRMARAASLIGWSIAYVLQAASQRARRLWRAGIGSHTAVESQP